MYNPRFMTTRVTTLLSGRALHGPRAGADSSWRRRQVAPSRIVGTPAQSELLWQKLDAIVQQVNHDLNGTMGVAIMDLTDGRTLLLNPDAVFAQASCIKVTVLAELYRQEQQR